MGHRIKVGISGLGRSGWGIHASAVERCSDMYELVAVSDPVKERRLEAERKFACKSYEEFESLINDKEVELVVIATPTHLHATQSIDALRAGKNVICEKPMATSLKEAELMIEAARKSGKILTVFHNRRYSPDFLKVKEIVKSGRLGKIVLLKIRMHSFGRRWDWQTMSRLGGGELNNNGSHLIDQALQLVERSDVRVLFCDLRRTLTLGDAEDHVKIILGSSDSAIIDIEVTHACAYPENWWLIMGTQGGLIGSSTSLRWKYFDPSELPMRRVEMGPAPNRSYNWEEIPWREESWNLEGPQRGSEFTFYEELYRTLRGGAPLGVTPESARIVMWIIEKCREYVGLNR